MFYQIHVLPASWAVYARLIFKFSVNKSVYRMVPGLPKASFGHGSAGCLMTIYDIVWVAPSAAGRRCVVQNNTWMLLRIFPGISKILLLRLPGKILTLHGVSRIFGMAWWVHQLFHPTGHAPPGMMLLIVSHDPLRLLRTFFAAHACRHGVWDGCSLLKLVFMHAFQVAGSAHAF